MNLHVGALISAASHNCLSGFGVCQGARTNPGLSPQRATSETSRGSGSLVKVARGVVRATHASAICQGVVQRLEAWSGEYVHTHISLSRNAAVGESRCCTSCMHALINSSVCQLAMSCGEAAADVVHRMLRKHLCLSHSHVVSSQTSMSAVDIHRGDRSASFLPRCK